jgi:orotate phosphoribosyltransferase
MTDILLIYRENGGLLSGHFLLSSGLHSDAYLQSEKVMMNPAVAARVTAPLTEALAHISFDTVVSPAVGGIRFGYELARQTGKRAIFTERVDDEMVLRRGFELAAGEKVIIAEDVITTGKSVKDCIRPVLAAGAVIEAVVCLIDRSGAKVDFGAPFTSLAKVSARTWEASSCPLCKAGSIPVKPGSRKAVG